jgi:hypothetical protein
VAPAGGKEGEEGVEGASEANYVEWMQIVSFRCWPSLRRRTSGMHALSPEGIDGWNPALPTGPSSAVCLPSTFTILFRYLHDRWRLELPAMEGRPTNSHLHLSECEHLSHSGEENAHKAQAWLGISSDREKTVLEAVVYVGICRFSVSEKGPTAAMHEAALAVIHNLPPFMQARWSVTRPGVIFVAKVDGSLDVWDFTDTSYRWALLHRTFHQGG